MSGVTVDERYPISTGNLPQSWAVCMIGDAIGDVQSGFASGVHNTEREGVPHLRPMNVSREGEVDLFEIKYVAPDVNPLRLSAGDILFNNTNSPELIGKTAAIPPSVQEMAFSNHMTRLRPPVGLNPRFVARQLHYLWMSGYFKYRCANHVNQASLSSSALAKTVPLLLAPPGEQDRIADEIDKQFTRLDAATAALKRVRANLKRYRGSVLKAACEGRLVPTEAELARKEGRDYEPAEKLLQRILRERRARWEADTLAKMIAIGKRLTDDRWKDKYNEPSASNATNLPNLPEGWCWASLDQVTWSLRSGTAETSGRVPTQFPVLKSSAVRPSVVDFEDVNYLRADQSERPENYVQKGDLLITRLSGTLEYVGQCALVAEQPAGALQYPDRLFCAKLVESIDGAFLAYCFAQGTLRAPLEEAAKSTAGHQRISMSDLYPFRFPLPPLAEQNRVVAELDRRLSVADKTARVAQETLRRFEAERQSVLRAAFSGKLVAQDPTDEHASSLLERIRAERHGASAAKPERRSRKEPALA
jgi:type I restriction enzyme, S subunit